MPDIKATIALPIGLAGCRPLFLILSINPTKNQPLSPPRPHSEYIRPLVHEIRGIKGLERLKLQFTSWRHAHRNTSLLYKTPQPTDVSSATDTETDMAQLFVILLLSLFAAPKAAIAATKLRYGYYSEACPEAESIVRSVIHRAMIREPRSAASVMRLQFHDCFVDGCDGSVLLDDTPTMLGEKLALSNINSLRDFEVIDEVKEALERRCPGVVSCADIIIMAARDAVVLSGGPSWDVKLGREDSLTASQEHSNNIMPSPRADATLLINLFHQFNLSVTDLVALSGSHSIGKARCFSIVFRLYNQSGSGRPDPFMDPKYRKKLDELCPKGGDENVTGGLDATPIVFDNQYFKDLIQKKGFLNSDQTLYSGDAGTRKVVEKFSYDQAAFFSAFAEGMVKMGDLQSDKRGEIRRNCRVVNDWPSYATI